MKKIFLTTIALLSIASASVFGMYGVDSGWIDFLTHGNQFRARLDQLGFTLGNDMIKGTFGFKNPYSFGDMLKVPANGDGKFIPDMSMGIGYTSSAIGIGVGYTMSFGDKVPIYKGKVTPKNQLQLGHTPVLVLNALDNALRIAVPIQVYQKSDKTPVSEYKYTAVSMDAQIRYYTGLDMLPQIRLYLRFGHYDTENKVANVTTKSKAESFGFDFRLYFGAMVEEVALQPIVKIQFNTALGKNHNTTRIQAINILKGSQTVSINNVLKNDKNPYTLNIIPALGISANSDIVSLYLEPSLGLKITGSASKNVKEAYDLGYGVYGEIYITPVKNVEWYFEASIDNLDANTKGLSFAGSTGITWYLPAL
ncbi:cell surface protein [Brachyspira aalborgi]|uniref:cell surface protein n=1 Tax=Brachyspira aalborgi TaxID=29522 RepID=UPI0011CC826D|nr:cell surface protein [Brachyspira aalborgi]TXJ14772.1 cell surface protein [Brachyspira aalborgi]TXJ18593.1 cell surface protein [Brachyspira aalborgi]